MEAVAHSPLAPPLADSLELLVAGMRRGDQRSLEALYDATVGKLYALATAILRNAQDAEEVVTATYSYAWSHAAQFDAVRANPLGWLLMLCRSRALDRLRQRRAQGTKVDIGELGAMAAGTESDPEDLLALMQQRSRIRTALAKLSADRRKLVTLAFLYGLSHQEIAASTGIALGTVKSHVRRALQELRAELEVS